MARNAKQGPGRGDQMAHGQSSPWLMPWFIIGPDPIMSQRQVVLLARHGITAVAAGNIEPPSALDPVLCDSRSAAILAGLMAQSPPRPAPLLVFGVNRAQMRARLILAGADEAISGRIAPVELAARMIAAQRACHAAQGMVQMAGFSFDTGLRQAWWQGHLLPLMPREFDLLLVLARHAGDVVSRDMLLRTIWRTNFDPGTNSLEVHVFKLRRRLVPLGMMVRIETVKHQGYRLRVNPPSQG